MISTSTWENRGALGGTRTPNLLIRSQMLYPLSYERSESSILHSEPCRCVLETRVSGGPPGAAAWLATKSWPTWS
jgi:hypothetical protein